MITKTPSEEYVSFQYADESTLNEVTARDLIVRYNLFRDGGPTNKLFDLQEIKKKCLRFHTDLSYHEDHIFVYSYYFLLRILFFLIFVDTIICTMEKIQTIPFQE